jgi:hypothetical protein
MNMKHCIYIICFLLSVAVSARAQVLNASTEKTLTLPDGVSIKVYAAADNKKQYYYLPVTLQLAVKDNRPEISLIVYKKPSSTAFDGGFLHLLVSWGLNARQEEQAKKILKQIIDTHAVLVGAAEITFEGDRLEIISGNAVAGILRKSLTAPVRLPSMPGQKSAAAFRFSAADAHTVWDAFHKPQQLSGILLRGRFYYTVAQVDGYVRTAKTAEGKMEASFRQWIEDLMKHNLIQTQSL